MAMFSGYSQWSGEIVCQGHWGWSEKEVRSWHWLRSRWFLVELNGFIESLLKCCRNDLRRAVLFPVDFVAVLCWTAHPPGLDCTLWVPNHALLPGTENKPEISFQVWCQTQGLLVCFERCFRRWHNGFVNCPEMAQVIQGWGGVHDRQTSTRATENSHKRWWDPTGENFDWCRPETEPSGACCWQWIVCIQCVQNHVKGVEDETCQCKICAQTSQSRAEGQEKDCVWRQLVSLHGWRNEPVFGKGGHRRWELGESVRTRVRVQEGVNAVASEKRTTSKKALWSRSVWKTMLTVFFLPQGSNFDWVQTCKSDHHCRFLHRHPVTAEGEHLLKKTRVVGGEKIFTSPWQCTSPCCNQNQSQTHQVGSECPWTPALYSPDSAPSDYALFPKLKKNVRGQHFRTIRELEDAISKELHSFPKEFFQKTMKDLALR